MCTLSTDTLVVHNTTTYVEMVILQFLYSFVYMVNASSSSLVLHSSLILYLITCWCPVNPAAAFLLCHNEFILLICHCHYIPVHCTLIIMAIATYHYDVLCTMKSWLSTYHITSYRMITHLIYSPTWICAIRLMSITLSHHGYSICLSVTWFSYEKFAARKLWMLHWSHGK